MFRFAVIALAVGFVMAGCGPKYPACENDDDCSESEFCVNNLCQQCREDGDCAEGQECNSGACQDVSGYCTGSGDCGDGQVCRDNRCGPCLSNADCSDGQVCMEGACGTAECNSDEECPAGLSCVGYRCKVDENAMNSLGQGECTVETLYYEFDSAELTPEMRDQVEQNFDCIQERGGRVTLEGHCDPRGTTEYNMALGERRARGVAKVFKTLGMEPGAMKVISKGEEEATGNSEEGWAKDRRVEFK